MTHERGRQLDLDLEPIRRVDAVIVGGDLTVVAHPSTTRIEAEVLSGPPLSVDVSGGTLTIRHRHRTPAGWLVPFRDARASIVVFVPAECSVDVRAVSAEVLVSGTTGEVDVRNVSGTLTLTGVTGPVVAKNVSGSVDAETVTGRLTVKSVSGDVTASGALDGVKVRAVSGTVALDLGAPADVGVKCVSGDVSIRLPSDADLSVNAKTTSGRLDSAFALTGSIAKNRISGRTGSPGSGRAHGAISVETVSGDFALLCREAEADPPEAEAV